MMKCDADVRDLEKKCLLPVFTLYSEKLFFSNSKVMY